MTIERQSLADYGLAGDGWASSRGDTIAANVAAHGDCENCGHHGLDYKAYEKHDGEALRRRSFAICMACGHAEEF